MLILCVSACPKVITLWGFHCIDISVIFIFFKKSIKLVQKRHLNELWQQAFAFHLFVFYFVSFVIWSKKYEWGLRSNIISFIFNMTKYSSRFQEEELIMHFHKSLLLSRENTKKKVFQFFCFKIIFSLSELLIIYFYI